MGFYDVQVITDIEECIILQIYASSSSEAETTAISMVETGEAGTESCNVLNCFAL